MLGLAKPNNGKLLALMLLLLLAIVLYTALTPGPTFAQETTAPSLAASITRTQWQIHLGGDKVDIAEGKRVNSHDQLGHAELYEYMSIPPLDGPGWQTPADYTGTIYFTQTAGTEAITFGNNEASTLTKNPTNECYAKADFTYFKTEVTIPPGTTISQFEVTFQQVDDGARAYIINSQNPYPGAFDPTGDIRFKSANPTTSNLAGFVVPGETNTVVIVQVDNCPRGNNLRNAQIFFSGKIDGKPVDGTISVVNSNPQIRYVDHDAIGRATGESWTDAFLTVGDALALAQNGDQIWVAEGVYYPDQLGSAADKTKVEDSNSSAASYVVPSGVQLYGGFEGTETSLSQRNWEQYVTVLSGDIEQDDLLKNANGVVADAAGIRGNNSHHIIYLDGSATAINESTSIDGFVVTSGAAVSGTDRQPDGGGLYCRSGGTNGTCSPLLNDMSFSGNMAAERGGAIFNDGANGGVSSPTLDFVTFTGNSANDGGALYNDGNGGISSPVIENATFTCNVAKNHGGAIYSNGQNGTSSPSLANVNFDCNKAGVDGGAMYNDGQNGASSPTLADVLFYCNSADKDGGAMYNDGYKGISSPSLTDVTFNRNSATKYGGAMYNAGTQGGVSSSTLVNVHFTNNRAEAGGALVNDSGIPDPEAGFTNPDGSKKAGGTSNLSLSHVTFVQNSAVQIGAMLNLVTNGTSTVTLTDVNFSHNSAKTAGALGNAVSEGGTSNLYVERVVFSGNSAVEGHGGAIFNQIDQFSTNTVDLVNVVFSGNSAASDGGAIYSTAESSGNSMSLTNVTLNGNSASLSGGAIYDNNQSATNPLRLSNVILWGNNAQYGASLYNQGTTAATISHSIVQNGLNSMNGPSTVNYSDTNRDSDPLFVLPVDPATAPTTSGNLRLQATSPAINAGDNNAVPSSVTTDLAGNTRILENTVDFGAYEFQGSTVQATPTLVRGHVVDAATDLPISGASVCLSTSEPCQVTDGSGYYEVLMTSATAQTFTVQSTGYTPVAQVVTPIENKTIEQDFALSAALAAGQYRIVLTWGMQPRDLDSHLLVPAANGSGPYNVHHQISSRGIANAYPFATLDVDDTDGEGPETITIEQMQSGTYVYAVNNYDATTGSFAESQAHVRVYGPTGEIAVYTPPVGADGVWWHVFTMENGVVTPVNTLQADKPAVFP